MTTKSPTTQSPVGYIPANTAVYSPTTTWNEESLFDCSFFVTKFGLLKIFQQIFMIVASVSYVWVVFKNGVQYYQGSMIGGLLLYFIIFFILLPKVHVLMWFYLLHKVERFDKRPWYTIEYFVCGGGAMLCLISTLVPLYGASLAGYTALSLTAFCTIMAAVLFIYNFYLVSQRKKMRLPLQGPETTM